MRLIPAFNVNGNFGEFLYSTFILGLLTFLVKPVLNLLMLPINIITLNLSSWIVSIVLFFIWTLLMKNVVITAWKFSGITNQFLSISSSTVPAWQTYIILGILFVLISKFILWTVN